MSTTGYSRPDVVRILSQSDDHKKEIYDILDECTYYELFLTMVCDVVIEWFIDACHQGKRDIEDFFKSCVGDEPFGCHNDKMKSLAMKYVRAIITPENEKEFYLYTDPYSVVTVQEILGTFATRELFEQAYDYIEDEGVFGVIYAIAYNESEQRFLDVLEIIAEKYDDIQIYMHALHLSVTQYRHYKNTRSILMTIEERFPGVKQKVLNDTENGECAKICLDIIYKEDV